MKQISNISFLFALLLLLTAINTFDALEKSTTKRLLHLKAKLSKPRELGQYTDIKSTNSSLITGANLTNALKNNFKSGLSNTKLNVIFENRSEEVLDYYWVDTNGVQIKIFSLQGIWPKNSALRKFGMTGPIFTHPMNTYVQHAWLIKRANSGTTIAGFQASDALKNQKVQVVTHDNFLTQWNSENGGATTPCFTKYILHNIHGWTVMVDELVSQQIVKEITEDLAKIVREIPPQIVEVLRTRKIFVNKQVKFGPNSKPTNQRGEVFHPAWQWLKDNGNLPDLKTEAVEIYGSDEWSRRRFHGKITSPSNWSLVHELSHSLQWYLTRFAASEFTRAYDAAMKSGKYNSVSHIELNYKLKAYACNNAQEYFASLSAAYWAVNDYYPNRRQDIADFDPNGFAMLQKIWSLSKSEIEAMRKKYW